MSQTISCRLCLNTCDGHKQLYDENGFQIKDLYEITIKYFDPLYLTAINGMNNTVLCLSCCGLITAFHNFQEAIVWSQTNLLENYLKKPPTKPTSDKSDNDDEKKVLPNIKIENEDDETTTNEEIKTQNIAKTSQNIFYITEMSEIADTEMHEQYELGPIKDEFGNTTAIEDPLPPNAMIKEEPIVSDDGKNPNSVTELSDTNNSIVEMISNNNDMENSVFVKEETEFSVQQMNASRNEDEPEIKRIKHSTDLSTNDSKNIEKYKDSTEKRADDTSSKHGIAGISNNLDNLDHNAIIALWRPKLKCPVCHELCTNFALLSQHFENKHHPAKCFIQCCNRHLYTTYHCAEHARQHLTPSSFKCKFCGQAFMFDIYLKRHISIRHDELTITAKQKTKFDKMIAQWISHLECDICHAQQSDYDALLCHFQEQHPNDNIYIVCCKERLEDRSNLAEHANLHRIGFKCDLCKIVLATKRQLKNHLCESLWKVKCKVCQKKFRNSHALKEHYTNFGCGVSQRKV